MSVNKGNRRLLRRLGDSLDTNLIVDGDIESGNYGIEYDTIMKARRKASFENNKFKGVELLNVEKPTALFLPQNDAYLEFTYDYTVDGIDYENTDITTIIPFKWSIEFDVKLTDYYRNGGYSKLYNNSSLGAFTQIASSLSSSDKFKFASTFWGVSNIPEVLDVELKNEDYVGKWYKFKMEVETFENETSYISVDYFGIHHEGLSDRIMRKFYGVSTTSIGESITHQGEAKYIKNVKIKYNDELILDCPDPVTGKNLVAGGVDATPNNIIYGKTK